MATRVEGVPANRRPGSPRPIPLAPRRSRAGRLLLALALITCTFATVYAAQGLLTRVWPAVFPGQTSPFSVNLPGLPDFENPDEGSVFNKRRNLLIVGVDKRPDEAELGPYRTDTIMVATLEPNGKTAAVLSFPRDMYIEIAMPDGTVFNDRINASYAHGFEATNSVEGGIRQMQSDIERNFGVETDYWVLMDFHGVEQMVDAIGGLDAEIPEELAVPRWWYSDDDLNAHWVEFPAGPYRFNGYDAVAFGRYRGDSDLVRVKRQEFILQAAFEKALTDGIFRNPLGLWGSYRNTVQTNLSSSEVVGLGPLAAEVRGTIATYSLGDPVNGLETMYHHTTESGAAVLLWNAENVEYWLRQVFTTSAYANSSVEVWDASQGVANAEGLGRYLMAVQGLPLVYLGPEAEPRTDTILVIYSESRREMAEDIAEWIGISPTAIEVHEPTSGTEPDVAIIVGANMELPDE